jgi:hypothetical protein
VHHRFDRAGLGQMQNDVPDPAVPLPVRRRRLAFNTELLRIRKPEGRPVTLFPPLRISGPPGEEVCEGLVDQRLLETMVRYLAQERRRLLEGRQFGALVIVIDRATRPGKGTALLEGKVPDQPDTSTGLAKQDSLFLSRIETEEDSLAFDHARNIKHRENEASTNMEC